jgi:hypothetical protein
MAANSVVPIAKPPVARARCTSATLRVEAGGEEAIVPQMGDAALQRKRSIRNPRLR